MSSSKIVRLLATNINPRDLSIGLVMLKDFALQSPTVAERYEISLHQWTKDFDNLDAPGTVDGLDLEAIVDSLRPEETDVFGFSMYVWNHDFMLAVARALKARNPEAVMLFGGSQSSGYGARLLEECDFVDYVIKGEGEVAFRDLLCGLLEGDTSGVANLFYRDGDAVASNLPKEARLAKKATYLPSIVDLPMAHRSPEYRAYLDNLEAPVTAQFETERGCPLSCAFCSWGTRLPIRRRHQADVEEGLTYLLNHPKVRAVYVVDANPFIKDEKGLWLTEFLLAHNKTGKPVFFELNPEYIRDERVIENLGKLQSDELAFGLQSTSELTLRRIKRRFHRDVYERNVKRLRFLNPNANIKFSLILGLPGDTYESFRASLDFAVGMLPADIYVHDLLVLPGSEMYDDPGQFDVEIDRDPPHRLVHNAGFPWPEIDRAKTLGFYVKLLHKLRWLRDVCHELHQRTEGRLIDLYADLVDHLLDHGIDALDGRDIHDVSSEQFDFLTTRFVEDPQRVARVESLFLAFCAERKPQRTASPRAPSLRGPKVA